MSTPLVAGIALTGQPKDYANVAAKRQADAAKPKVDKELDAYNKEVQKVLKINENVHPGLRTELEDANTEALGRATRLVSQGDFVGANSTLRDISNRNAATIAASNTFYDLERVAVQGGYNLPEGLQQFWNSQEFSKARGANKVKMFDEFMSDEKNLPYKALFQFGYDERGRPTFGVDMGALKKQDVGRTYGSALQRIKGQVLLDGIGEELQRRNVNKGSMQYQQEVRGFVMNFLRVKFWELAADRSFRFNAALRFPEINSEIPEERNAAVDRFIEANAEVWPQEFKGFLRASGGGSRKTQVDFQPTLTEMDAAYGYSDTYRVSGTMVPFQDKTFSLNVNEASQLGEKNQFSRVSGAAPGGIENVTVNGAVILPVYTGKNQTIDIGDGKKINLTAGFPLPLDLLKGIESNLKKANIVINWENRAYIRGQRQKFEGMGSGSKEDAIFIPLNEETRGKLRVQYKDDRFATDRGIFGDSAREVGKKGVIGAGATPKPAQNPTPKPTNTPGGGAGGRQNTNTDDAFEQLLKGK